MIILAVFTMLTFNPYYYPSPPLWYMVANMIYSFWKFCHYHKECISGAVHIPLLALTYLQWWTRLPLVHFLQGRSKGSPDYVTKAKVLTYYFTTFYPECRNSTTIYSSGLWLDKFGYLVNEWQKLWVNMITLGSKIRNNKKIVNVRESRG